MTRLLVIGASRGIGLETVRAALAAGHAVRAFARGGDRMALEAPALEKVAGDATDNAAVAAALEGVDAVALTLGAPRGGKSILGGTRLFSEATRVLLDQMTRAGPRRLVAVTGYGAGESRVGQSRPERAAHRLVLGGAYADKDRQEALIRDSDLDWLILRPVILTNGPRTGRVKVLRDRAQWRNGLVSRADVAAFLVREAAEPTLSREAPVLAY